MSKYIEYAKAFNANEEVLNWCDTVLVSAMRKRQLDQQEVEHTIDYLISPAAPTRLRKMSYKQAAESAGKWTAQQQRKGRNLIDSDSDVELIHDFLDGTRIVRLITREAYQREGFLMAHCVGGYDPSKSTIYSYRDKKNVPHATFEVQKQDNRIVQIKGKGNGSIHPRYIHPILTFLRSINMDIRPADMANLGYYHVSEEIKELFDQFTDPRGKKASIVTLFNHNYII